MRDLIPDSMYVFLTESTQPEPVLYTSQHSYSPRARVLLITGFVGSVIGNPAGLVRFHKYWNAEEFP